ncbi:MAG: BlaI/MecI/CopY family transcriptional regulator [Gemmatimonadota bacterium]
MHNTVGLTELQISILQVIWEREEATTQDVWEALSRQRPLALTTVATLLSRLERKRVVSHRQMGRQFLYRATVTRAEVRHSKVRELTDTLFGGDASALLSHLVSSEEVDARELDRIRAALEEVEEATPPEHAERE